MKKIILMSVLAFVSLSSFAQLSWNAKVGMNVSNYYGKVTDGSDAKLGFKVGVGAEYAFTDMWSVQPDLFFSTKGTKYSESVYNESVSAKINEMYLELPVNAQFRIAITHKVNMTLAAGPYFAVGVGGKRSLKTSFGKKFDSVDMDTFGKGGVNRFDCGLGIGLGAEFGRILVGLDGQCGFVKLSDVKDAPRNLNFSVTLGYKF